MISERVRQQAFGKRLRTVALAATGLALACAGDPANTADAPGDPAELEPPAPQAADLGRAPVLDDPADGLCIARTISRSDEDRRQRQIAALTSLGAAVVRQEIKWHLVQPEPDVWDWTSEDATVDAVTGAGLELIGLLAYGTPWASSATESDSFFPPDDPADYAAFAAAAAERYGDRVRRWEIWNEPNSGFRFWKKDPIELAGNAAEYAELFVAAAKAIHAVDPSAEVMVGGTFFHEQVIPGAINFLSDAKAANPEFADVADAVAFHPYMLYAPRVGPEESEGDEVPVWQMMPELRELMDLPLVATEFGWPSYGSVDEGAQADYLVRQMALLHADGVRDACWFTLGDGRLADENPEHAFGLYRNDETERKPAGNSFAALAEALAGTACYGRAEDALGLPDGALAVRYVAIDGKRAVTVVWAPKMEVEITIPNSAGCEGWSTTLGAEDLEVSTPGAATFTASGHPAILVESCGS